MILWGLGSVVLYWLPQQLDLGVLAQLRCTGSHGVSGASVLGFVGLGGDSCLYG
jgi:hypothetical protein